MKRNMLSAAIFTATGICVWNNFNMYVISAVAIALVGYCSFCFVRKRKAAAILAVISVCFGFCLINISNSVAVSKAEPFNGKVTKISGKVCDVTKTSYGQQFVVKHGYSHNGKTKYIKIKSYSNNEGIEVKYGDVIEFDAKTRLADSGSGFGDYNERMNDRSNGILLKTTGEIKNVKIKGNHIELWNIFDMCRILQTKLCERAELLFTDNTAALVQGIVAGEKENISDEINENFRISGLSHILVVSGMHVNIILTVLMFILSATGIGKSRKAIVIYLLVIWLFTIMTGAGFSAVRAATVVTILFLGKLIYRDADPLNSLGLTVLIMIVINPSVYYNVGFRLSVFSTASILVFAGVIKESLGRVPSVLKDALSVTVSAQLGALPIIGQSFGIIGVFGILSNLIVAPLIVIVVAVTIAALILGSIPFVGGLLIRATEIAYGGISGVAALIAKIPFSQMELGSGNLMQFAIYGMFLYGIRLWLEKNKTYAINILMAALVCLCITVGFEMFTDNTNITFLHTGNSDCTILQNKNMALMFDGGGDSNYNVAESVVAPYMRKQGIDKIDVAFVTHYHDDHAKGVMELIEMGKVKRVIVPVGIFKSDFGIFNAAEKADIPLHYIGNFDKISLGDITVEAVNTYDGSEENNGMVYFVSYGENRICISGDVHKNGEAMLIESGIDLKCNILKVPHHGSDTSGSEEFLRKVSPEYAVILRGDDEYPTVQQTKLYEDTGIKIYSTNDCGSIKIKLSKNGDSQIVFGRSNFYELRNIKKTSQK